jgi:phosphoribosylanthranilate isomerase
MSRPFIKYCGNKNLADYQTSLNSQADYIGFVFAESKRQVKVEDAARWVKAFPPGKKKLVGVFVNQPEDVLLHAVESIPLDVVQCHGNEKPDFTRGLKSKSDVQIWKVIHHQDGNSILSMKQYQGTADAFIIDKKVGNQYGGTGSAFDWSYVPDYIKEANNLGVPCIIAGGINEGTLPKLLSFQPDGIDTSSGIEKNFQKNKQKMTSIESMVKKYDTSTHTR